MPRSLEQPGLCPSFKSAVVTRQTVVQALHAGSTADGALLSWQERTINPRQGPQSPSGPSTPSSEWVTTRPIADSRAWVSTEIFSRSVRSHA